MSASSPASAYRVEGRAASLPFLLLAALLVAFFAAWPLVSEPGFLNTRGGGDSPFLLQRLQQLELALRDGHFPVRWMRDANYGFGYPFFNYYAPLSIYVAAIFRFLGFSFVRSIEAAQISGFLLAAAGIFLLAKRWYGSEWAALLASVAYTVAPFHLVNVYVRGDSLAEFWAMALYPWTILAADLLLEPSAERFPYGRVAGLAAAYAALILSHNISALIFTPFLMLFACLRWLFGREWSSSRLRNAPSAFQKRSLLPLVSAGLLALALAAWFFWPALAERGLAQLGPVTEGYFYFANHFRGTDLVQASPAFDYDVAGGNAFRMGLVQAVLILGGMVALFYATLRQRKVDAVSTVFISATLILSTLMITPVAASLWEHLPLLPLVQFPWRFLSIQAFAGALVIGALALLPHCRVIAISAAAALIAASFSGLRTDHLLLGDADITPESLAAYEWFSGNIGSTVSAEYLPETVQPRFFNSRWLNDQQRAVATAPQGEMIEARRVELATGRQRWLVQTGAEGATVVLPVMAWPGWEATIDGETLALQPAPGSGHIMASLPAGEHLLTLRLRRTPSRMAAELLSLSGLLILLFLLYKARRGLAIGRPTAVLTTAVLLFLLAFRVWPEPQATADNLNWDFAQMAFLHHDQKGVPFSSGTTLAGYTYSTAVVEAGEELQIDLVFQEANEDVVTVAIGTPALIWPTFSPQAPPISAQSRVIDAQELTLTLPIPANAPAGMVVPRLTMAVGRPLMPSGRVRGDLFLRPLHITNDRPVATNAAGLDVYAEDVRVRDSAALDVRLVWSTQEPLTQNYVASLLLLDESGKWVAQRDVQPGYGFLPSSGWTPRTAVNDWLAMPLPEALREGQTLTLVARLYEFETGRLLLTRRLGDLHLQGPSLTFIRNEPVYTSPLGMTPLEARFGESIRLRGYSLEQQSETTWELTLYWQALQPSFENAVRFVHIFDPLTETIVAQVDGWPRNNSYPTSQWTQGEIVTDTMSLQLDEAAPGLYRIGTGFYREEDTTRRLPAVDQRTGSPIRDDRLVLPPTIER